SRAPPTLSRSHPPGDWSRSRASSGCAVRRRSSSATSPASTADTASRNRESRRSSLFIVAAYYSLTTSGLGEKLRPRRPDAAELPGGRAMKLDLAKRACLLAVGLAIFGSLGVAGAVAQEIPLTSVATDFNNPIGIDHHAPSGKLVFSVNFPSGLPHNFELVVPDGSRTAFSDIQGLTDEVKIATVRGGPCQGGFTV